MDWEYAIEKHRNALLGVLAMLVAMAGMRGSGDVPTLPRHLHRAVLRLLRPAESAVRRLIIIMARGLVVTVASRRDFGTMPFAPLPGRSGTPVAAKANAVRVASLPFCDPARAPFRPWRSLAPNSLPRISVPGVTQRLAQVSSAPSPDDPLDARRILGRLRVLQAAMDDLPGRALRFARWRAASRDPERRHRWPLRHSQPPGGTRRRRNEVQAVLADLQGLALEALAHADTS